MTFTHKNILLAVKMSSYLISWQMKSKRTEINQKKWTFICMYLPCPLVKQKKMQMQMGCSLDVTGTMNYVRQKLDKHIENAFSCAVHAFTRTPQWKYCPTIHHYLFYIPCIETHTPIVLLWIIQTFFLHSSLSCRNVWTNWCRDYSAMSFVLPSSTLPCLCS